MIHQAQRICFAGLLPHLPAPDFPNYAAGSDGPISWHELLGISGNTAGRAIGYGKQSGFVNSRT
jgi:hypothetical protein